MVTVAAEPSALVRTIEVIVKHDEPIQLALIFDVINDLREAIAEAQIKQITQLDFSKLSIPDYARQNAIDYIQNNKDLLLWLESVAPTSSSKFGLKMALVGLAFLSLVGEKSIEETTKQILEKSQAIQTLTTNLAAAADEVLQPIADLVNQRHQVPARPHCPSVTAKKKDRGLQISVVPSPVTIKLDYFQPKANTSAPDPFARSKQRRHNPAGSRKK